MDKDMTMNVFNLLAITKNIKPERAMVLQRQQFCVAE